MAKDFSTESEDGMRKRYGHDMTWSCDIHAEPIKFRCKEHNITVCLPCAVKDHQKPCQLEDIGDVILDIEKQLEEKQKEIDDAKTALEQDAAEIKSVETLMRTHLQSVNDEVNARYKKETENLKEREKKEIRRINEERDKRIKECREKIEEQHKYVRNVQQKLNSECEEIEKLVSEKMEYLRDMNQHTITTVRHIDQELKEMKPNKKKLTGAPRQIALLDDTLSTNSASAQKDCLRKLKRGVETVKLMKGGVRVDDKYFSRLRGGMVYWDVFKEIQVPQIARGYNMIGLISNNEVCLGSMYGAGMFVMNVENERTDNIVKKEIGLTFTSCASAGGNLIVCGTSGFREGRSPDGCIILYSRQHGAWKVVREISIPRNNDSKDSCLRAPIPGHRNLYARPTTYVDADMDGMILAGEENRHDIFVINWADGKIVSTITTPGEKVGGRIRSLPSGNIWVECLKGAIIISRSGEIISREPSLERYGYCCYITSSDYKIIQEEEKILVLKSA